MTICFNFTFSISSLSKDFFKALVTVQDNINLNPQAKEVHS